MTLSEYIESLQQFLVAHPEAKAYPVVDSYGDEPTRPEIDVDAVVLADRF